MANHYADPKRVPACLPRVRAQWAENMIIGELIVAGKSLVARVAFFCFDILVLVAQQPTPELALDEAARAFEQGKTAEAEQKLRPVLEKHPSDLRALLL